MRFSVHTGVFRYLRHEIKANALILIVVIVLDIAVLAALLAIKASTDRLVLYAAVAGMIFIFAGERFFLRSR